jgi:hypothetical protein
MTKMNADNLKNNLTNLAREYLWEVDFVSPIGGGDAEALNARCQSTAIPGSSFGSILIPFKASPGIKFPGKLNMPHAWTCTFVEGADKKVFEAIHEWKQLVIHDRLNVGSPDVAIKSDVYLRLLDIQGNTTGRYKIVGCYPELVDDTPLAYDREGPIVFTVTFSYDRWEKVD